MTIKPNTLQTLSRRRLTGLQKKNLSYWLFLIPFLIGFCLLFFWIYFDSLHFSFSYIKTTATGFDQSWNGLANYRYALREDAEFFPMMISSVSGMLLQIPMVILYSLFIAVILSQKMKGRTVFRALFFIPVILATGFMAKADMTNLVGEGMWNSIGSDFNESASIANGLFTSEDMAELMFQFSFSPMLSRYVIGAVIGIFDIINVSGVQMLVFLAGLQSISPSIYESADIDGATTWESFWLITFPLISPIILVNVVYTVIDSLTRPDNAVMVYIQRMYSSGKNSMGNASAMAWLYFVAIALCVGVIVLIIRGYIYYQQKD
ncbi:MAG: sugar ABC transporter permease [Oscillospiraceae bacterium]|nr:sugar ABC transporter permease [Oscillospiraceae bacterium]